MNIIEQMLKKYEIHSKEDIYNALREIFQEITLLGLYNGGFFEKATFYGGTCLRIFYGLPRFSEDLDCSLLQKDENFNIEKYFGHIVDEFEALGIKVNIAKKIKQNSTVESAFLKNDTKIYDLSVDAKNFYNAKENSVIKIKIEADTNPPLHFETETKMLLLPKSFSITTMTLPNLYAGKIHALLFRDWKMRVKGRDWFDFEWYVKNNVPLNLKHLYYRIKDSGNTTKEYITQNDLQELLLAKIDEVNFEWAIDDAIKFVKNPSELEVWNKDYFRFLVSKIHYQQKRLDNDTQPPSSQGQRKSHKK